MKIVVLLFISSFTLFSPVTAAPISLKEAFHAARLNMESIQRVETQIKQTEELKNRARASILPTLAGVGSYTKIDPPASAGQNPFLLTRQYSAALRLSQPLLRGGSVSAFKLAEDNLLLSRYQRDATELNLYQLVISAFYNLYAYQRDVQNVDALLKFSKERVKEIRERTIIGRSRKGELVEAQAQLHKAESQFQDSRMRLFEAQKTFEFYTNVSSPEPVVNSELPEISGTLQSYLLKLTDRPDLLAARQESRVADRQIEVARGGHYPQVDLTSNYFFDRTGILSSSEWDVGVAVSIPLYQGGGVNASVREAVHGKRIAELRSKETQRIAERELSISFQNFLQLREQLKALKQALQKSEEAYKLNKRDYQFGLVTNLDVLQSLNMFIETKRSHDTLVAMGLLNYNNLEALSGSLP
jgi:outer membrane protein